MTNIQIQSRLNACLTEESSLSNAGNILHEFRVSEMTAVLKFFIEKYEQRKDLLPLFWNDKSDACPLEEGQQDDQIINFRRFVGKIDDR